MRVDLLTSFLCLASLFIGSFEVDTQVDLHGTKEKEYNDTVKTTLKVDFSKNQQVHPNPKRFTRTRKADPIPHSIVLLKTDTNIDKHVIHRTTTTNHQFDLLVMVESSPHSLPWRRTIRDTWGSILSTRVSLIFVIPSEKIGNAPELLREMELHEDIILFKHVSAETKPSIRLIHYIYWCTTLYKYKYLLRTSNHFFLRVDGILNSLGSYESTDFIYMGYFKGNISIPKEDLNWLVCPTLVPHADEGGYLLSKPLIQRFLNQFYHLSYFHSEGGSLALWISPFKHIKLEHRVDFDSFKSRGCTNTLVTHAESSVDDMKDRFSQLSNGGQLCANEFVKEQSYIYNWSGLPSQCCKTE